MHTGLALITGTEDRQHAYVALSRGTARNRAYVFTRLPAADLGAGLRPAPELDRYDRLTARQGRDLAAGVDGEDGRERAIGVLAWVVGRDGEVLSATATPGRGTCPLPITSASCTRRGKPRPPRPARTTTPGCCTTRCPTGSAASPVTRRSGCGGRCTPPSWPAGTPLICSPTRWPGRT